MKFDARMLGVALCLTTTLGGCSVFGSHHLAKADKAAAPAAAGLTEATFTRMARAHLDADRNGQALEAFQAALAIGEPRAPVLNGMGVAYARIGRADLAFRYFEQAVALAPDEDRYLANLMRLTQSPQFAMSRNAAPIAQAAELAVQNHALVEARPVESQPAPQMAVATSRIQRTGKGQVFIQSAEPMAAPVHPAMARVDTRFRPLVRVDLAAPKP